MRALCHRCHGELPGPVPGSSRGDEDELLFCPRCGAPQLLLPEHMRPEVPAEAALQTTGATPPPRLLDSTTSASGINWRPALYVGLAIAGVGLLLVVLSLVLPALTLLDAVWVFSAAIVSVSLYVKLNPSSRMNALIGMRIGVTTALLTLAAMGIGLSITGVVMRFGTHSMEQADKETVQRTKALRAQVIAIFNENVQDKDLQQKNAQNLNSPFYDLPEVRAGSALFDMAAVGVIVLLFSAFTGAFVGKLRGLQAAREGLRPHN